MYRPTVLPRDEALSWWRDDRPPVAGHRSAVGINEVECRLCLDEIRRREAPPPVWNQSFKLPLATLWSSAVDHLIKHHGVRIEPDVCPTDDEQR